MPAQGSSFKMMLPNGRNVELLSNEGANEAVAVMGIGFLSANLNEVDGPVAMSRASLQNTTDASHRTQYIESIFRSYLMLGALADKASPEKVASCIPESELKSLVDHIRSALGTISADRKWLRTGSLEKHDLELLHIIMVYAHHESFLKVFIAGGGFEAVTQLCASRKDVPSPHVCSAILIILHDSQVTLRQERGVEKAFGILQKSGLLGQAFRCMGISTDPTDLEVSMIILDCLQECTKLIRKKLKSGTPTGDILDAVIRGKDGGLAKQDNAEIKTRLANLQKMALMSNYGIGTKGTTKQEAVRICRYCNTSEAQMDGAILMKCAKCKATYYCSRECQVADWKGHKILCKLATTKGISGSEAKAHESAAVTFVQKNYFAIVEECYKKTQEYNVPKKELVIELSFYKDAPALRDEFKVGLTSRYLEGSRPDEPDWFWKGTDVYEDNIKGWLVGATDVYSRMTSDRLLAFCRFGDGSSGTYRVSLMNTITGKDFLSDEAVDCIGREDDDGMLAILGQRQTDEYYKQSLIRRMRQMAVSMNGGDGDVDTDSDGDD
jgi:hypothetical protein